MTICVRVENRGTAPQQIKLSTAEPCTGAKHELGLNVVLDAGASRDVFVHKGVCLVVEEVVEEVAPEPASA